MKGKHHPEERLTRELKQLVEGHLEDMWYNILDASEAAAKRTRTVASAKDVRRSLCRLLGELRRWDALCADRMIRVGRAYSELQDACLNLDPNSREYKQLRRPNQVVKDSGALDYVPLEDLRAGASLYHCLLDEHGQVPQALRKRLRATGWVRAAVAAKLPFPVDAIANGVQVKGCLQRLEDLSVAEFEDQVCALLGWPKLQRPRSWRSRSRRS